LAGAAGRGRARRSCSAARRARCGGKARALLRGRTEVTPADVRAVAQPVFRHRIITNFQAEADGVTAEDVIRRLLETTPRPDPESAPAPKRRGFFSRLFSAGSA
jgi:MoxR-like ATPase